VENVNPQQKKIKVFILEDNPDDIELELYALRKAQYSVEYAIAQNRSEFLERLPRFSPDIILADYALPDITGIEAIAICRETGIDAPVMLITGEGNETIAVDSLRLGAIDYILKKNITGLPARVDRAIEIWEDRKAKKRAEAEELRLQQLLSENQKMEAIGRLAGGIAHDFNNILTGVMGFAELCMVDIPTDSRIRSRLESVVSLSQKGADLVKQLLIFSRKMVMELKDIELNTYVTETMHFLKRIVEETIEIRLDLNHDGLKVKIDSGQFTQVLMNLILNARDAMHAKGVITLKTGRCMAGETAHLDQQSGNDREYACISISDTGSGIEEYDLPRIFDPFFTTKEVGKGTGLGLSIVYSVVKAHHGVVTVASWKGEGTTFTIYLPCSGEEEEDSESPFYEKLPSRASSGISGQETILIAEDEDVLRTLLSGFMRSLGYTVITAQDGKEALTLFEIDPGRFHIVISDMLMPYMGGIELFQELRDIRPQIKFILVTGYSLTEVDENLLAGMTAVLRKPYKPMQLINLVRDILDA
jgi:two-component system, cell cycle sensor histidine kinase and response regulator CckA